MKMSYQMIHVVVLEMWTQVSVQVFWFTPHEYLLNISGRVLISTSGVIHP